MKFARAGCKERVSAGCVYELVAFIVGRRSEARRRCSDACSLRQYALLLLTNGRSAALD